MEVSELFDKASHPARIKILTLLIEAPLSFSQLKKKLEIASSGNLSFHLSKMEDLVYLDSDGLYKISDDGKKLVKTVKRLKLTMKKSSPRTQFHRVLRLLPILAGIVLLFIGFVPVTSVEEVISSSFTVNPGTRYGPYDNGTVYHTRINFPIMSKSVLKGEVIVEGGSIYLTLNGYIQNPLSDSHIKDQYSFKVDPADDLYTFIFDNTEGHEASHVEFRLEEIWTRPMAIGSSTLFIGWLMGLFLFLAGSIILVINHFKSRTSVKC